MLRSSSGHPEKSIQVIKLQEQEKLSSRRRSSIGISVVKNAAPVDVYYGGSSVAVPFHWESCPGTPKVRYSREKPLPPLTPPPSFLSNQVETPTKKRSLKHKFFRGLLPKLNLRKSSQPASPASSSSSSSWSSRSVPSSPQIYSRTTRLWPGSTSSVENVDGLVSSPVSTLCFGGGGANPGSRGRTSNAFKVLLAESA